jgi:PKD repeat protein
MVHTSEFLNHSRDTEITVASGDDEPQISLILDQRDTWGLRALGVANLDPARDDTLRLRQGDQRAYAVADEVVLVPVAMGGVDAPTADFADTTAEADYLRRTFDASLSAAVVGREILVYLWHFGDGRVAWGRESIHTFPEAGTYEVMLTVVDSEREVGQITKSITITESDTAPPTARFTTSATSGTVPFTVEFDSGPAFAPAGISALNWDFGDGTGGEGALISHTYREKGSYLVELELVDGQGRRSYARSLIEVEPGGTSIEGAVTVDNRQARQVSLEGSWVARKTLFAWEVAPSAYPDADFFHQYTFGADAMEARTDGSRVTFTPDLPGSGLYEVYLWSQYAFIGSRGNIVPVEILGTEGITISPVNQAAWLDRWAPLGIVAHEDGSPFSLSYEMVEDGPRIFADAIKLVPYGGKSTRAKLVVSPYRGQAPLEVSLGASGSEAQAGSPSFSWDFGDGSDTLETSADTVSHVYDDAGTYHVTVTVRDAAGREASATDYVEVLPANQLPVASFTASATEGQAPLVVAFDAADSADVDGQIDRYQWVLPGGEERWGQTLVHAFTQPGVQKIILRVWDDDGEFGEASHQVTVSAPAVEPVARLNVSSPPEGSPLPWRVQLDAGGSSGGSSPITFYRFFYGSTSRTVYAPDDQLSIELDRPGIYPVTLTVTTADGRTAQTQSLLVIMEGRAFETDQVPLNITPGDAPRVNITGDWAYTEPENTWDDANTGKGDKSITFTETALETDEYLLLGHWPAGAGNATNARFVIDHAGGEDVVIADQRTTHAAGNILGIYSFQAGDPAVITLENAGTDGAVALQGVSFLKLNPSN